MRTTQDRTIVAPLSYPGLLELDAISVDGITVVTVAGELDTATVGPFRDYVGDTLGPGATVVIDLASVPFVDSTGIGGMVGLQKQAVAAGATLVFRNPCEQVAKVLRITRVNSLLAIDTFEDSAFS